MILHRRHILKLAPVAGAWVVAGCGARHEPDHAHAVFFAPDSDALDGAAREVLRRLAIEIAADRPRAVSIDAFANRRDDGSENVDLAARRASAVASALQSAGVDPRMLAITVRGSTPPAGGMPVEGRRVDILVRR